MKKMIERFLKNKCKKRSKFELADLEQFLVDRYGGQSGYQGSGGYKSLVQSIKEMQAGNQLKEVKSSPLNGRVPPLKTRWIKIDKKPDPAWSDREIFRLSDLLNLSYYIKHPGEQTDGNWNYILNVYHFLREKDKRKWASLEERSLELFGDEKFLTGQGRDKRGSSFLKKIGLLPADLKAKKYGQMFIYWNRGLKNIKEVLILENHSTFFSCKRAAEAGIKIFDLMPDALIFGQGKRIIKSLSFIEEIADPHQVKLYYSGDIDPEGFMIYHTLKKRYPEYRLQLHLPFYIALVEQGGRGYPCQGQFKRQEDLECVLDELRKYEYEKEIEKIRRLWHGDLRIPQELITYEYIYELGENNGRD